MLPRVNALRSLVYVVAASAASIACGSADSPSSSGPGSVPSLGGGGAADSRACTADKDCAPGESCVLSGGGEIRTGTCSGPAGTNGSGAHEGGGASGGVPPGSTSPQACGLVCTGGQGDPNRPYDAVYTQNGSTISTGGSGSGRYKIVGDDNVITTDGGGSVIFDIYGSHNRIFGSYSGGGSIVANVLSGTENSVDFDTVGGCNAANFTHGTLHVNIRSCGAGGDAVNGRPAESRTYTLP